VNPELPRLIGGGGYDTPLVLPGSPDNEGFSGQGGITCDFDRCKEGIHIDMYDSPLHVRKFLPIKMQ
jgi:hypothetical protein